MRIHKIEMRHVRQIKELTLEFTSPLTILGGPNEGGKSTFQQAILAAMFFCDKKTRDSLVSRFDPHSPPVVTIHLLPGNNGSAAVLTRRLTDDQGEWRQGPTVIKQKGKALEQVQKTLPIGAEAAALLLWGVQEDLARVIDSFPSDGHSLLTGATIRGCGPDPKAVMEELDKEFQKAKSKASKDPGSLTRAEAEVNRLDKERQEAQQAEERLQALDQNYQQAKTNQAQGQLHYDTAKKETAQLAELEKCLKPALKALEKVAVLEKKHDEWDGLEEEIARADKERQTLHKERALVLAQLRVVRDAELAAQVEKLQQQIERVEAAENTRADLEKKLAARARPDQADVQKRHNLRERIKEAADKMEASGVRYTLSVSGHGVSVQIREDDDPPQHVMLQAGQTRGGVVGRVTLVADALEFTAAGKEDIASLKHTIDKAQKERNTLLAHLHLDTEEELDLLIKETTQLKEDLTRAEQTLTKELKGSTLAELKSSLATAAKERNENGVTEEDQKTCQDKHLGSVKVISDKHARLDTQVEAAAKALKKLEGRRPSPAEETKLKDDRKKARQEADCAADRFAHADDQKRPPTPELLEEIQEALRDKHQKLERLHQACNEAGIKVAGLASDLRNAAPKRPLPSIEADLQEAQAHLRTEQVFQSGREMLRQRIQEKIEEMTQSVPRELENKIGDYFSQLTRGTYGAVHLNDDLTLASVQEKRAAAEPWPPGQLSCGTRHQAALALKVAVARALAESAGPVFIILDDYLVHFDPARRAATENLLLDLVADRQLQIILLTCHTDWAAQWQQRLPDQVAYLDFASRAVYYQGPSPGG